MKSEADSDTGARVFYCMEVRRDMNHEASTNSFRRERVKEIDNPIPGPIEQISINNSS